MSNKRQIIELLDLTDHMLNKCDPEAVKLIPGRMLSILRGVM